MGIIIGYTRPPNLQTSQLWMLIALNSSDSARDEGLAEALADGLLRPKGVVATNFLPHVDLAAPLAAYGDALASRPGLSFSSQAR